MADNNKTPEEIAAEKRQQANALRNAIEHFMLKLRVVGNSKTIEEQLKILSKYNDFPSKEDLLEQKKDFDSYQKEFIEKQHDLFFSQYPEMLEYVGDKKTDNNTENFLILCVKAHLFSSNDEETLKKEHKENLNAYYMKIMPQYESFLIKYIVDNEKWELTQNTPEAFTLYSEVYQEHKLLLNQFDSPLTIGTVLKAVNTRLLDKIVNLKAIGLDAETYSTLVDNVIIGKFKALLMILNQFAGGGINVLNVILASAFKDYSIPEIIKSISEIKAKITLNEKQIEQLDSAEKSLKSLVNSGVVNTSSNSGCLGVLMVFILPLAGILYYIL